LVRAGDIGTILRFDVESLRSGIPNEFRDRLVERVHKATEVLADRREGTVMAA
jgi:hypothetical protein